jgi:predicted nucleic acid-binding protein
MARPGHVFGDTSFFFACLEPLDAYHQRALEVARRVADGRWILHTTWDVVSETTTLLRYRSSFAAARTFLSDVKPTLRIVEYGSRARVEAEEIFLQYAREHRLSLCDAISFVVITSLLEGPPCLTFDDDFRTLGLTVIN